MTATIPSGWYPDPSDSGSAAQRQRWWNGTEWTGNTRPAPVPGDGPGPREEPGPLEQPGPFEKAALAQEAADGGQPTEPLPGALSEVVPTSGWPAMPPGPPPMARARRWRVPKAVLVAAAVAVLIGAGIGSGATYLGMRGGDSDNAAASAPSGTAPGGTGGGQGGLPFGQGGGTGGGQGGLPFGQGGGTGGGQGGLPFGQGGGTGGGQGGLPFGQGGGTGGGQGGTDGGQGGTDGGQGGTGGGNTSGGTALDPLNGISLPVPSGWTGGTTDDGHAALSIGSYSCSQSPSGCSLGGVVTSTISKAPSDPAAAAKTDISAAVKEAYGTVNSHQVLESQKVTVAGRSGYLVRWKVDAKTGNDGYVETVVFPTADGKSLAAVHFGFDIADKAPQVSLMDTIVKGIQDDSSGGSGAGGSGSST